MAYREKGYSLLKNTVDFVYGIYTKYHEYIVFKYIKCFTNSCFLKFIQPPMHCLENSISSNLNLCDHVENSNTTKEELSDSTRPSKVHKLGATSLRHILRNHGFELLLPPSE